tara:strand:+ start:335 stop:619 length:285 start_codon:yes stop_codon:yes gene_type:complete
MKHREKIICADGFSMSVQAGETLYCEPRIDDVSVEVGFPTVQEPLLDPYCEDPSKPTTTVYGYVPVDRVSLICAKHGGVVSGELPPGIPYLAAL